MEYQGGNKLADVLHNSKMNIPDDDIVLLDLNAHSFDFYTACNHKVVDVHKLHELYPSVKDKYFLLDTHLARTLETEGFEVKPELEHADYNVTTVKLKFLEPNTRLQQCDSLMLAHIYLK
jgi:hypothetical protein